MWAALKSPLIIGADLRTLPASALSILNNPAVIAISQDPVGRSASRIRRDTNVAKDKYGIGEIHVWSGPLYGGDQVVVFLNAAGEDTEVSASLVDIFFHEGPEGSAPQVKESWEVFDLWGSRMDVDMAEQILNGSSGEAQKLLRHANWYNSTEISYEEGLKNEDSRLLGKRVDKIDAYGVLTRRVKTHSAEIFRLRRVGRKHESHPRVEL